MAARCETPLASGQACGVIAIGRCDIDGRAFCGNHQAPGLVNRCKPCWEAAGCEVILDDRTCVATPVDRCARCGRAFCENHRKPTNWVVDQWGQKNGVLETTCKSCDFEARELEHRKATDKRFRSTYITELAVKELTAAGVPTIELVREYTVTVRRIFSTRSERRTEVAGTGWLLGKFRCSYNDGGNYGGSDREDEQLIVLTDHSRDLDPLKVAHGFDRVSMKDGRLIRVIKKEGEYIIQGGSSPSISSPESDRLIAAIHKLVAI